MSFRDVESALAADELFSRAAPLAGQSEGLESLTEKFSQAQKFIIIEKLLIRIAFTPFSTSLISALKLNF